MKKNLTDPVIKFFVSALGLVVILMVLKELQHIFLPFVIAYFLFFIFEPLNDLLVKYKLPLGIAIFVNIVIMLALIFGASRIIIDAFVQFSYQLPTFEGKLNHIISTTAQSIGIKDETFTQFNISELLQSYDYGGLASGLFSSTVDLFTYIFLILFFFIFISSGHGKFVEAIRLRFVEKGVKSTIKKIKKGIKDHDNEEYTTVEEDLASMTIQREMKLQKTFKDITEQIQKYILTKFLISLLLGVVVGITCWAFGIKFFIVWAVISILLNFIPNIGSVIAVLLISLMALIQYESFSYALFIASTLILIQNLIGNLLEPKIVGNRLGLNPLVILLSLMLWGYLWGIIGMFLSVPLTAVIKIIISNSTSKNMRFITNLMSS